MKMNFTTPGLQYNARSAVHNNALRDSENGKQPLDLNFGKGKLPGVTSTTPDAKVPPRIAKSDIAGGRGVQKLNLLG